MKKLVAFLLALTIVFSLGVPAFASESVETPSDPIVEESPENETPFVEKLLTVYSAGAENLKNGVSLTVFTAVAGVPLSMIPFGALAALAGIPGGLLVTAIGLGELGAAPVIALFMDENTNLEPIDGFDAEEIFGEVF